MFFKEALLSFWVKYIAFIYKIETEKYDKKMKFIAETIHN